jgi:hypothetical protein
MTSSYSGATFFASASFASSARFSFFVSVVAGSVILSYRSKSYSASRKRASAAAAAASGLASAYSPRFANSATVAW